MKVIFLKRISVCLVVTALAVAAQAAQVVPVIEVNQNNSTSSDYVLSQNSQLMISIQQLQDEVRSLRGQLESQEYRLKRIETDQKERYRDLDRRMSLIIQSQMQGETKTGINTVINQEPKSILSTDVSAEEKASPQIIPTERRALANNSIASKSSASENNTALNNAGLSATKEPGSLANDQDDYQASFALVRGRDFTGAVNSFTRFLADYPDSPRIPNAYYWLGEVYLAQGNQNESEAAFLRVADQYSDSGKAADALYKLGILYKQQGNLKKSMVFMSRVVKDYPETSAAQLASSALNQ